MKTLKHFLMLMAIIPLMVPAQEWQNICPPGVTLYTDPAGQIKAFRLDSVVSPGNGDSVYYSYQTIRYKTPCSDTTHGSVLGQMVHRSAGGLFHFFNHNNDTLSINTTAPLNATWKFCNLQGGGYILAKTDSVIYSIVLGMPDSVRIISFQAYDSAGNPVSHLMNTRQFSLSKHYGLSEAADMYTLPESFTAYSLSGKTALNLGIPDLDAYQVYNFNIDDEFHYISSHAYGYGPGSTSEYEKKIVRILGKEVYGNVDSVVYLAEECINHSLFVHQSPPPIITLTHDTIWLTYRFTGPMADSLAVNMPGEYAPYSQYQYNMAKQILRYAGGGPNGRQIQVVLPSYYYVAQPSFCYSVQCCWPEESYVQGLGKTGSTEFNEIYNDFDYDSLWYYKKGTEVWGTPVASDCSTLLTLDDLLSGPCIHVSISPNPVHDWLQVSIDRPWSNASYEMTILDLPGHVVFRTLFHESPFVITRPALPAGLYIWRVTGENRTTAGKIVLD